MLLMFGKNLKKIRNVRGMSQQEFADIFDLKRGTLGAYEEGRSNPKLETVIKIANHFSIGLEELLISELTVNRLLKFNEHLAIDGENYQKTEFEGIPCILPEDEAAFINTYSSGSDLNKLSSIRLPFIQTDNRLAFTVDNLAMTSGAIELFPKDIVIGVQSDIDELGDHSLVVVLTNNNLLLRKIYQEGENVILKADHHGVEDVSLSSEEIVSMWKIEHVFNYSLHSKEILLENRLTSIEQSIASLEGKKNQS